ncbi:MAG: hypothetical protein KA010_03735 [Saprospiraceae bacterium]|nr:hypothetical protein [Saprospiraceae bacterium]
MNYSFTNKHFTNILLLPLLAIILLWGGCKSVEDFNDVSFDPSGTSFAIPVLHTSLSMNQMIKRLGDSTFVSVGPDDLLTITYKGKVSSKTSTQIFDVFQAQSIPFALLDTVIAVPYSPPGEIDVDYAILKSGTLYFAFQSYHMDDMDVTLTIPEMTLNGQPFTKHYDVNFNGFIPQTVIDNVSLAGYQLQSESDSIYIKYTALHSNGVRDTVSNFIMQINELKFGYAEGYWGNELLNIDRDTIEIDFFNEWSQGQVYFENPIVRVNVASSFGFPVGSIVNVANFIPKTGVALPLESPYVDQSILFDYPKLNEVGQTKSTRFSFTKDNSNIREIVSSSPVAVDYDIDAIANPESDTSIRGFITDSSEFRIEVEVDLPIHGNAKDFITSQTFDFDFCDLVNKTEFVECGDIKDAAFRLATNNELPINVDMQFYVADADEHIIDSLLTGEQRILEGAHADIDGNVLTASKKITDARLPLERIADPSKIKKIIMKANFSTYNHDTQSVKVLSSQKVDIRMGLKIDMK